MTQAQPPLADSARLLVRRYKIRMGTNGGCVRLNDGIHHMAVALRHDGERVVAIRGWTHQFPWSTCCEAPAQLQRFLGYRIDGGPQPEGLATEPSSQCTHLLDLARLAIRHAPCPVTLSLVVRVEALDDQEERLLAKVWCGGQLFVEWHVCGQFVEGPAPFAGHDLTGKAEFPPEIKADANRREAAMMLRRAVKMIRGRNRAWRVPVDVPPAEREWMRGVCHTFQPGVAERAVRAPGSVDRPPTYS